jgi:hypothetical protein
MQLIWDFSLRIREIGPEQGCGASEKFADGAPSTCNSLLARRKPEPEPGKV